MFQDYAPLIKVLEGNGIFFRRDHEPGRVRVRGQGLFAPYHGIGENGDS